MKNCALCARPCGTVLFRVTRVRQWPSSDTRMEEWGYEPEWICDKCWPEAKTVDENERLKKMINVAGVLLAEIERAYGCPQATEALRVLAKVMSAHA